MLIGGHKLEQATFGHTHDTLMIEGGTRVVWALGLVILILEVANFLYHTDMVTVAIF